MCPPLNLYFSKKFFVSNIKKIDQSFNSSNIRFSIAVFPIRYSTCRITELSTEFRLRQLFVQTQKFYYCADIVFFHIIYFSGFSAKIFDLAENPP